MKTIGVAIVVFALIYADVGYVSKDGADYEGSTALGLMTMGMFVVFFLTLILEPR